MATDDLLRRGIAALKTGHKAEARNLLMQVIEQDERNEMAWLWLSGAVDTDKERRICLENVLAVNPNNSAAKRGLERLPASTDVQPLSTVSSPASQIEPSRDKLAGQSIAETKKDIELKSSKESFESAPHRKIGEKKTRSSLKRLLLGIGGIVLLLLAGFSVAYVSGLIGPSAQERARITEHVASHRDKGESLDNWCEGFALLRFGDRVGETEWTAARKGFNNSVWTVRCRVDISTVTAQGKSTHSEPVMVLLYNADDGYIYLQSILGETSFNHLQLLAYEFDLDDIFGQPKIYAPLD